MIDEHIGYTESLTWTYIAPGTLKPRTTSFEAEHKRIGSWAIELVNAAKRVSGHSKPSTIVGAIQGIKDLTITSTMVADQLDFPRQVDALTAHVESLKVTSYSRWSRWNRAFPILAEVARFRGVNLARLNPFPRHRRNFTLQTDAREHPQIDELLKHARKDARCIIQTILNPPADHVPFIESARALAERNMGRFTLSGKDGWTAEAALARRWRKATGLTAADLTRYLYPSAPDLIPFLILLTYAIAGNADSVALLLRDSIVFRDNPLTGPTVEIELIKDRANAEYTYTLRDTGPNSDGWTVRSVQAITAPLVSYAGESFRNYLFLHRGDQGDVRPLIGTVRWETLCRYQRDRDITPPIQLNQLRPIRGNRAFRETGDIFYMKRLLRQQTMAVAIAYADTLESNEVAISTIADVQANLTNRRAAGQSGPIPQPGAEDNVNLPSHKCLDVSSLLHEHDADGLCQSLLWPFNDRHFVLVHEPRAIAHLLRDYYALCEAETRLPAVRFERAYAVRKRLIGREIASLSPELLEAARRILSDLPALPAID